MKRIIALSLCLIVISIGLVACGGDSEIPKGMKRAKEDSKLYTLYVPESWVEIETNSDAALVQAKPEGVMGSAKIRPETVNAMVWGVSDKILTDKNLDAEARINKAFESFIEEYKAQLNGAFTEISEFSAEETVREDDARAYVFTAKHNKIYYKYYVNVIVANSYYYVVTFNFPQNNLTLNDDGGFNEMETIADAKFSDDEYLEIMDEIILNFKTHG